MKPQPVYVFFFLWKSKNVRYLRYMSISVRKYDDQPLSLAYTQ